MENIAEIIDNRFELIERFAGFLVNFMSVSDSPLNLENRDVETVAEVFAAIAGRGRIETREIFDFCKSEVGQLHVERAHKVGGLAEIVKAEFKPAKCLDSKP